MTIIDLKPYIGIQTRILEATDTEILFATNNKKDEKHYCSINIYYPQDGFLKEIYCYEFPVYEFYNQYMHILQDEIMIVKNDSPYKLDVITIDRVSGEIKANNTIETQGEITSIPIFINHHYLLFYQDINEDSTEYERYTSQGYGHYDHGIYLYDLLENKTYLMKDFRVITGIAVVHGLIDGLPLFKHNHEDYLIFNETNMSDYEYEDIYDYVQEKKADRNTIESIEALYFIRLDNFINSIKKGDEKIPFEVISSNHIDGWVRYFSMDENNIYYREKDFKTQVEKIIKMSKETLRSTTIMTIDHKATKGKIMYASYWTPHTIYEENIIENVIQNTVTLKGIYNCNFNLTFNHELQKNELIHLYYPIDNRYILGAGYYENAEDDDDYYDIYYIIDLAKDTYSRHIGSYEIYKNTLIMN